MKTLSALVGRHIKMFFKDKGTFFTSLIAPLILLVLFVLFWGTCTATVFILPFPRISLCPIKSSKALSAAGFFLRFWR